MAIEGSIVKIERRRSVFGVYYWYPLFRHRKGAIAYLSELDLQQGQVIELPIE